MPDKRRHFLCSKLGLLGLCLMLSQRAMAESALLTVTTVDGVQQEGELVAWNDEGVTLRQDEQTFSFAASQLLHVQQKNASTESDPEENFLELLDGTHMPHSSYVVERGEATIKTPWRETPLVLSTNQIRYVQFSTDVSLSTLREQDLDGDLLVVRKKTPGAFSFLAGIIGDVSEKQVDFNWEDEKLSVKRSKIAALAYFHAHKPPMKKVACWLNLHHGGRLPVAKLELRGKHINIQTSSGLKFSIPVASVRNVDYSQGKLAYLSDLQPVAMQWTPRIDLPLAAKLIAKHGQPRRDESFTGSTLSLAWPLSTSGLKNYSKGLALRSRTEIRYRLPKGMQHFKALAGIDPETSAQGNVTLEIFADNRPVWQGEIDGSSAPVAIEVPLDDARELRIVVDYGKNLDFGDRLHLIEARVSR